LKGKIVNYWKIRQVFLKYEKQADTFDYSLRSVTFKLVGTFGPAFRSIVAAALQAT